MIRSSAGWDPDARPVAVRARSVVLTYDAPLRRLKELSGRKFVWVSVDVDAGVRIDLMPRKSDAAEPLVAPDPRRQ